MSLILRLGVRVRPIFECRSGVGVRVRLRLMVRVRVRVLGTL